MFNDNDLLMFEISIRVMIENCQESGKCFDEEKKEWQQLLKKVMKKGRTMKTIGDLKERIRQELAKLVAQELFEDGDSFEVFLDWNLKRDERTLKASPESFEIEVVTEHKDFSFDVTREVVDDLIKHKLINFIDTSWNDNDVLEYEILIDPVDL